MLLLQSLSEINLIGLCFKFDLHTNTPQKKKKKTHDILRVYLPAALVHAVINYNKGK
jgi:hypothetical protein